MNQIDFNQEGPKFGVSCNEKVESEVLFVYSIIFVIIFPNVWMRFKSVSVLTFA